MSEILFQYHRVDSTTWVYLSSLLMIGLYFKFSRFWSVRNLDLMLLILLAPGLLIAQYGSEKLAAQAWERAAKTVPPKLAQTENAAEGPVATRVDEPLSTALVPVGDPRATAESNPTEHEATAAVPKTAPAADAPTETAERSPQDLRSNDLAIAQIGYLWLFAIGGIWLVRLLLDPTMVRRPLLEPNLTTGGLVFIGVSLFIFLMANVWTAKAPAPGPGDEGAKRVVASRQGPVPTGGSTARKGPGYAVLDLIPSIPTAPLVAEGVPRISAPQTSTLAAKLIVIFCHLAVVLGVASIGYWHFGNIKTGVGVAALYLMLPYTAQMTGQKDHVIPAALLVWAVLCYRRPLTAGVLIGLATSLVYYPLFLLPLWVSFYWRRGVLRFASGVVSMLVVMAVALVFIKHASYWENLKQMFGLWLPLQEGLEGIWGLGWNPVYRIPVLAAFVAMTGTLAIWPAQKNLGTLLSCSAAVMVATQFWHGYGGGLYMGWYLPLALLTVFRPNLEDRVALAVLGEGWGRRRIPSMVNGFKAALL